MRSRKQLLCNEKNESLYSTTQPRVFPPVSLQSVRWEQSLDSKPLSMKPEGIRSGEQPVRSAQLYQHCGGRR